MVATFKRRTFLQISLRSCMIALTVVAIWIGGIANRAHQQKRAVNRIRDLGGSLTYHHEVDMAGRRIKQPTLPGPPWLRELIGAEYFDQVREISLHDSKV